MRQAVRDRQLGVEVAVKANDRAGLGGVGIFNGDGDGILGQPDPLGGVASPLPSKEETRRAVTCDEPECKVFFVLVDDFLSLPKGWTKQLGKDYCPRHSDGHVNDAGLDAELEKAERVAGFGDFPAHEPDFSQPDNPVAHPLPAPPRFPAINGWWFALFALLILVITGLVLYADVLRHKISNYEFSLALENASSFEHRVSIQSLDCTGHEVRRCSGLIINDGEKRPVRYICDSTHCAFECGGK
jgi:hypothetical protein